MGHVPSRKGSSVIREMLASQYKLQALEVRLRGKMLQVLMNSTNTCFITTKGSKISQLQAVALGSLVVQGKPDTAYGGVYLKGAEHGCASP